MRMAAERTPMGGAAGDSGATTAAATTITVMTTLTTPIAERNWTTHHWTMVGGRGSGGRVMMHRITQLFSLSFFDRYST